MDDIVKKKKFGQVFLVESFYRRALKQHSRHELNNRTSMIYLKHVYDEEDSQANASVSNSAGNARVSEKQKIQNC